MIPDLAPQSGGPVTAVLGMTQALAKAGAEIRLLATDHATPRILSKDGVRVHLFPCRFCPWRWSPELSKVILDQIRWADLVHLHTLWSYPTWVAARVCWRLKRPYILRPAGMLDAWSMGQRVWRKQLYLTFLERPTIQGARAIHWTSEVERAGSQFSDHLPPSFVLPLGLAPRSYENLPDRACFFDRFPSLKDKVIILFLGRLHHKKQPDVVIRAFHALHREFPKAVLVFAGDGNPSCVETLRNLVLRLRLETKVQFLGFLPESVVREAVVAGTLFVLPSLQENFGLATAEAMAAGCPVIVSPQVALAREVQQVQAGLVIDGSSEAMAYALRELLKDEARRTDMGSNGRRFILGHLTWDRISRQILQIYEDILSGSQASGAWR